MEESKEVLEMSEEELDEHLTVLLRETFSKMV